MPSPEQQPEINVYQGNTFEAEISETDTTFTAKVTNGEETIVFRYTPPGRVSFEVVSFTQPFAPVQEQETTPEKEKAVSIYGRTATDVFPATAPSGEPMLIVSFAEHPSWDKDSFGNTEPAQNKNDTRYWQVAAFGKYTQLLEGLPKGKAGIMIGYPKEVTKKGKSGQEETVKNGFHLVNRKPYLGTPKPRGRT